MLSAELDVVKWRGGFGRDWIGVNGKRFGYRMLLFVKLTTVGEAARGVRVAVTVRIGVGCVGTKSRRLYKCNTLDHTLPNSLSERR